MPDFFGLCPSCQKKFSGETFQNCCRRGGERNDYEKFLLDSIFPTKLTEFHTKLTEFVPFIFIISQYCPTVKRILPDWLCLPNKLGGLPPPSPPPPRPVRQWTPMIWRTQIAINMQMIMQFRMKFLTHSIS